MSNHLTPVGAEVIFPPPGPVTAAAMLAARQELLQRLGLSPDYLDRATPDEQARFKQAIFTLQQLDGILADIPILGTVPVLDLEPCVKVPATGFAARLLGKFRGNVPEVGAGDQRRFLNSTAYEVVWDQLLALGFTPSLKQQPNCTHPFTLCASAPRT